MSLQQYLLMLIKLHNICSFVCVQMTVTWTSGYGTHEAEPFIEWGPKGGDHMRSPAGTLTFDRNSMCGV